MISVYVRTDAALLLASGSYADLHGRCGAMVLGLVMFAIALAACGLAPSALALILARGVQDG